MKLESLQEAKIAGAPNISHVTRLFSDIKKGYPTLSYDHFAWFVSSLEADLNLDRKDLMHVFYDGYEGLKGNPTRINDVLESFFGEEYDEEDSDTAYQIVLQSARKFFQIKL